MIRRFGLVLVLLALIPACASQPSAPSPMRILEVKASLDTLWTRYAFASDAHDAGGFELLFASDATISFSNAPTVTGAPAIGEFLGKLYSGVDATALRVDGQYLNVMGNTAFQTGTFEEDFTEGGVEKTEYGRFALYAEQAANKEWRLRNLTAIADSIRP